MNENEKEIKMLLNELNSMKIQCNFNLLRFIGQKYHVPEIRNLKEAQISLVTKNVQNEKILGDKNDELNNKIKLLKQYFTRQKHNKVIQTIQNGRG